MKILLKNARLLKMDDTPIFITNIVIYDNKIKYIGDEFHKYGPFDIERNCNGNVIMPGFKNAHTHSAMTFLRSKTDDSRLQEWLFDVVFPRESYLKHEDVYHLSKVAFLEYLTSGITACLDQYFYPTYTLKAAKEIGMRITVLGMFGDFIPSLEEMKTLFAEYNTDSDSLTRFTLGLHAEYTSDMDLLNKTKEAVEYLKSPLYVHISETAFEVEDCKKRNGGLTPVQYLDSFDLFKYGGAGFHCCFFEEDDIEIFKKHQMSIVSCPGSNTKLASGIAPISKYMDAGLNIAIGTDGPASNNCLNMFKEMSLLSGLQKLSNLDPRKAPAYEVLKMATVGGAKAMNLNDADILEVGKKADLIEIDLYRPSMQPINNIINNIVYSGDKDIVKMTMIDGHILYDSGKFNLKEDIADIYRECQKVTDRLDKEVNDAKRD